MPTLSNTRLTNTDLQKLQLFPDTFTPMRNVVHDFVDKIMIPNFLLPKINFKLPLPINDFHHQTISYRPVLNNSSSENFGFKITVEGRFLYYGKTLKHISLNSKHGVFLSELLRNKDNYVSDQEILNKLNFNDYRNLGYIKRDMKKALRQDGFEIKLYRARSKGYKLIALTPTVPQ